MQRLHRNHKTPRIREVMQQSLSLLAPALSQEFGWSNTDYARFVTKAKKIWPQVLQTTPAPVRLAVMARMAAGVALFD